MKQKQSHSSIVLSGQNDSPRVRIAENRIREACRYSSFVRLVPPRNLFACNVKSLPLPPSWTVQLGETFSASVQADAIVCFEHYESIPRVLLLCVDTGKEPVESSREASLFLRTTALFRARAEKTRHQFLNSQIAIVWIVRNAKRMEQLRRCCDSGGMDQIYLITERDFIFCDDVLSLLWQLPDGSFRSLI